VSGDASHFTEDENMYYGKMGCRVEELRCWRGGMRRLSDCLVREEQQILSEVTLYEQFNSFIIIDITSLSSIVASLQSPKSTDGGET
jgi:hypothetical protein